MSLKITRDAYSLRSQGMATLNEQSVSGTSKKTKTKTRAKAVPASVIASISARATMARVPLATRKQTIQIATGAKQKSSLKKTQKVGKAFAKPKERTCDHAQLINRLKVASPRSQVGSNEAVKSSLRAALERDKGYVWLEATLKQELSKDSVKLLVDCFKGIKALKSVATRFSQIESAQFETKPLDARKILHLAFFIEVRIQRVDVASMSYFAQGENGLARALQVDSKTRDVYLIADPEKSKFNASGSYKTACNVVRLVAGVFEANPEIAVQLSTQVDTASLADMTVTEIKREKKKIEKGFSQAEAELGYFERFGDVAGIAEFYSAARFEETVKGEKLPRLSMIFKKASSDIQKIIDEGVDLSLGEQLKIAKELFSFFGAMHKAGFIHGDIKGDNILRYEDGEIGVTDFGEAFKCNRQNPKKTKPTSMFNEGMYGTVKYTALELFARFRFREDFTKTDAWALGCLLYELYFQKPVPWQKILDEYRESVYDDVKEAREEIKQDFTKLVNKHVEKVLAGLLASDDEPTDAEQYEMLIYSLLRVDPKRRASMGEAGVAAEAIEA